MPIMESAWKRMRQNEKRRAVNRAERHRVKTARTRLEESAAGGDSEKAKKALQAYFSALDKAAKHGVIKKNTADRKKSRAVRLVAKGLAAHQSSTTPSTTS